MSSPYLVHVTNAEQRTYVFWVSYQTNIAKVFFVMQAASQSKAPVTIVIRLWLDNDKSDQNYDWTVIRL